MRSLFHLGVFAVVGLAGLAPATRAQVVVPTAPPPSVVQPILPAPTLLPVRALTLSEFASGFKPLPGTYEVLFQHPKTCCPVKVCFTLPPGCIRKVRVNSRRIEFVYKGQRDVVIRFLHNGKVWVRG